MQRTAVALLLAAGAAIAVNPALAQKQTLRMAYWAGPSHHMVKTQDAWIKTVEEASGGNLTITVDKAPLAKPEGQYDLIKNGVRDIVWHIPGYTPGRQELIRAGEMPFLCPNATVCSPALWKWYEKHKLAAKEFTDTKLLTIFMHGPGTIHTLKPAVTLEQLKDLKMRVGGSGVPIAKALGVSVVSMPATDAHEALQRGTVSGVFFPWEAMDSFRLTEMVKHHLEIPGGLYSSVFVFVMNNAAFDKLTPANQAALMKASGEAGSRFFGKAWDAADKVSRDSAKARGNVFATLSNEELAKWRPLLDFVRQDWLAKAKEKGVDGNALLSDLEATIKALSS
jgi:TRAP-type C4-dicarboxylate transport system substrate-binding protein